jgi:ABC-type nitrate/sulfonate/bicarbonate transport system substrate-binding protein
MSCQSLYNFVDGNRGINDVPDLKGKTIELLLEQECIYFTRFLELNNLSFQDVTIVDLKTPTEWGDAAVNGSIDAVARPAVCGNGKEVQALTLLFVNS